MKKLSLSLVFGTILVGISSAVQAAESYSVPEPSTLILVGTGLIGAWLISFKRKKK